MTTPQPRRRAPGMSPEQRRQMIVLAALPLVAEHGAAVTTAQIARTAGIGEATIFRVFTDKDELLDACVVEALRPDHVLEQLAAIPLDRPLTARLAEATDAMRAHATRIGAVLGALHASGRRSRDRLVPDPARKPARDPARDSAQDSARESAPDGPAPETAGERRGRLPSPGRLGTSPLDRAASFKETREALAELFEPERDELRLDPDRLAALFLNLVFSATRHPAGDPELSTADLVDVFVHGALNRAAN
ncbi:TetR family transcriptional regulator [Streptosporangium sp. NPDC051022]|uniref:TetR/AcrR family transcriptional regulator n=1 Tax=Streptosporangium sp. NPDC051022 TaxID=3155752 RepID=UPI00342DA7FC